MFGIKWLLVVVFISSSPLGGCTKGGNFGNTGIAVYVEYYLMIGVDIVGGVVWTLLVVTAASIINVWW